MKQYQIAITHRASADMEAIFDYIASSYHAPDTAMRQYDRIAEGIESLRLFPERYSLFDSQPEHDLGLRRLLIDNYSAVYIVEDGVVTVLRVLYSSSDIMKRLREDGTYAAE